MNSVPEQLRKISGQIYLDGVLAKCAATTGLEVIDPATKADISEVSNTPKDKIDMVISQANAAQKDWWQLSALDRVHALHLCADTMRAQRAPHAEVMT